MLENMRRAGDAAAQARTSEEERAARERAQHHMAAMHLASAGSAGGPPHANAPQQGYGGHPPQGAPVRALFTQKSTNKWGDITGVSLLCGHRGLGGIDAHGRAAAALPIRPMARRCALADRPCHTDVKGSPLPWCVICFIVT